MNTGLYFIAFTFPPAVRVLIEQLKLEISEECQSFHALKTPAHITLLSPQYFTNEQIDKLELLLQAQCGLVHPQAGRLNGFGHFRKDVLFLKCELNEEIYRFQREMIASFHSHLQSVDWKMSAKWHPHVTVAFRDLTEEAFMRVWPKLEFRMFEADFILDTITLFKHNEKHWQVEKRFKLGNQTEE